MRYLYWGACAASDFDSDDARSSSETSKMPGSSAAGARSTALSGPQLPSSGRFPTTHRASSAPLYLARNVTRAPVDMAAASALPPDDVGVRRRSERPDDVGVRCSRHTQVRSKTGLLWNAGTRQQRTRCVGGRRIISAMVSLLVMFRGKNILREWQVDILFAQFGQVSPRGQGCNSCALLLMAKRGEGCWSFLLRPSPAH
jgi:hypothetical protein